MKKALLLLVYIGTITAELFSQNTHIGNAPIGQYIDINQNEINDYVNLDYDAPTKLNVSFSFKTDFAPGAYYNREGDRFSGFIKFKDYNRRILYKQSREAKVTRLNADDFDSFTIGIDSFAVYDEIVLNRSSSDKLDYPQFMGVVVENEEYILFKHLYNAASVSSYMLFDHEKKVFKAIPRKGFVEVVLPLVSRDPSLVNQIENKELGFDEIEDIFKHYDYFLKYSKGKPIFFTKDWNETKLEDLACFKGYITGSFEEGFDINYTSLYDQPILKGSYSSLFPLTKEGAFIWYDNDGLKVKYAEFKEDKIEGSVKAYFEGKLRWSYDIDDNDTKVYTSVFSTDGKELLDENGNGSEIIFDSVNDRNITRVYENNRLKVAYFEQNERKIYQKAERNVKIKSTFTITEDLAFSDEALAGFIQGNLLLKVLIDEQGAIEYIEVLDDLETKLDQSVIKIFEDNNKKGFFRKARSGGDVVAQEVVIPVSFNIKTDYLYQRSYNFDPFFMQRQMMMHQAPLNVTPPPRPGNF